MTHTLSPRRGATAIGVIVIFLVSACGGTSHKPTITTPVTTTPSGTDAPTTTAAAIAAPSPPPDPCSLVSQADAQALAQTPLQAAVKSGSPPDELCQYTGPPTGPTAQVEIFVGDGAKKSLDIDRDTLQHPFTTLTGIADEAYLEDSNIFLRKGDVWVQVNVVLLDLPADQVQSGLQTMAKKIASEL